MQRSTTAALASFVLLAFGTAPTQKASENTVVRLVREARAGFTSGARELVVELPQGEVESFTLGRRDRKHEVDCRFLKETTLILQGHPEGTTVKPMHDERGWGTTIAIAAANDWEGRVHLVDLTILASGASSVATTSAFGKRESHTPYKDLRFLRCTFLDHPLKSVDCVRPVSVNHAALSAIECVVNMPNSREHWLYSRNPYNADQEILRNRVIAVGGQILQFVSRPGEGPSYGPSTVTVADNDFRGYHRNCDRAATAITIAGSGQDWIIERNVVADLRGGGCFRANQSGGGIVVWNGGTYWEYGKSSREGAVAVERGQPPPAESHANGTVILRDNVFIQPDADRPTIALEDALEVRVEGNTILGRQCSINVARVARLTWRGNNTEERVQRAIAQGLVSVADGKDAPLVKSDRSPLGKTLGDDFTLPASPPPDGEPR